MITVRRLLIVPGVKPVTVVFSVAGEDRVNAKSHWTVHFSKTRKGVVSVGRGTGYQAEDALRSGGGGGTVLLVDFSLAAGGGLVSR